MDPHAGLVLGDYSDRLKELSGMRLEPNLWVLGAEEGAMIQITG
jgi:hypothetical protein